MSKHLHMPGGPHEATGVNGPEPLSPPDLREAEGTHHSLSGCPGDSLLGAGHNGFSSIL